MNEVVRELAPAAVAIGIGATVIMDLWAMVMKRVFSVPSLDYRVVGRWMLWLPNGRVIHDGIGRTPAKIGETLVGWIAHYGIGILFAGLLIAVVGRQWAVAPTLLPALGVGWISLAAPFFILQPCFGAGIAASKTPTPNIMRLRSFIAHTSFGVGLYLAALVWAALIV